VSLPVRFHPLAEADLAEAWSWYEERQPGLGDRLVRAVRTALDMAARWPSSGTPVIEGHDGEVVERRITTSGFPYAVRYRTIDEAIVVMAVYHQRRHPDFGAERSP
jgi:plasmid stabilization system protein ParE